MADIDTLQRDQDANASRAVSKQELFFGFLKIGLLGFGGIAPWARHVIVEERRWVTEKEFAAILGIGQMAMPLVIVTSLAVVYERFATIPEVRAALIGAAAGAAGLVLGTALKMTQKIKPSPLALLVAIVPFVTVGVLGWALVPVVIAIVPLSIAAAALERRA